MKKGNESDGQDNRDGHHKQHRKLRKSGPAAPKPYIINPRRAYIIESLLDILAAGEGLSLSMRVLFNSVRLMGKPPVHWDEVHDALEHLVKEERVKRTRHGYAANGSGPLSPAHFKSCLRSASELEAVAEQAAGLLRALSSRLFHEAQTNDADKYEMEDLTKLEHCAGSLAEDLVHRANGAVTDRLSDFLDARTRLAHTGPMLK